MTAKAPNGAGRSPLLFIFLTVFIDLLGFGIVIPLLPVYSKAYGASELMLGLLFAAFSGMQLLFAPVWGRLSDRIGRKPILVGGLFGTSLSYVLFAYSNSFELLMLSRLLAGFFGANISTAQAYIADVTTPENRAKGMGLIGAAFGLGFTLGPGIGGELTHISASAPGWFAAGFSCAAAIFGWINLPEPEHKPGVTRIFGFGQVVRAIGEPRIGVLFVLSYTFIFAFSSFEAMFTRFGLARFPSVFNVPANLESATMEDVLAAAPIAGRYLMGIGIISALIQGGLIRRLVPRYGETKLAVAGPLLLGLGFLVVGLATTWTWVIVGCLIMPLGFGLNNPALTSLVSRASPEREQGSFLGLNQSVSSFARMTGPPFAGLVFAYGPEVPFLIGAGLLGCSCLLARWYHGRFGATFPKKAQVPATGV
ncbi:MAG: MFS transporter [Planctomycetes bacterium]|nr:MFS transporter [Planctomycetota bacterium]